MATAKHTPRGRTQDRRLVAAKQAYEPAYEAKKLGVSTQAVVGAIRVVGHDRRKIEAYLKAKKGK